MCSAPTTSRKFARRFSSRRNCSRAAWAKRPTLFRKRCTRGRIAARAASEKGQSLTLRPEATAGIVRAYIQHNLGERGLNKLYCIGPMFRRERPQKGRYRQFYQIDAEIIGPASAGSESPARDAEISGDAGDVARPAGHHRLESGIEFRGHARRPRSRSTTRCARRWSR